MTLEMRAALVTKYSKAGLPLVAAMQLAGLEPGALAPASAFSLVHRFVDEDAPHRSGLSVFIRAEGSDTEAGTTTFTASTADEDRALDVVKQDWNLKGRLRHFKANPVILDNHRHLRVAGAADPKTVKVPRATRNLEMVVRWDLDSPDPLMRTVGHQHLHGFRSAGSVGFRSDKRTARNELPEDHEAYREPITIESWWGSFEYAGVYHEGNHLLEFSSASVPMNPYALQQAGDMTDAERQLRERVAELEGEADKAEIIARATTPRVTADELISLIKSNADVRRAVVAAYDASFIPPGPSPSPAPPTPPPAIPAKRRSWREDGLDHLSPDDITAALAALEEC